MRTIKLLMLILVFALLSCGSSYSSSDSSGTSGTGTAVSIVTLTFSPQSLTTTAGSTVTWTNNDTVAHTVTSGLSTDTDAGSVFSSATLNPGDTFSFQFSTAGTYNYHCSLHTSMAGTVTVQ